MSATIATGWWTERRVRAMGSAAHVICGGAPGALVAWACDELLRLERAWSRFLPDSELSHCNTRAGTWVEVSAPMLAALTRARELWQATGGAFDPTMLDALERAGYDRSFDELPPDDPRPFAEPAPVAPGYGPVAIDIEARAVLLPRGTRIDLGGIGKGLATDLVARGLIDRGARSALVAIGGDMRACGEPPDDTGAWQIPVEHPLAHDRIAFTAPLAEGALVTSTTRIRRWTRDGAAMHHIIDPAHGSPARTGVAAVVAAAPEAWWAEGIAKAMIVLGLPRGIALARRTGVHAWCYLDDGEVVEVNAPE